MTSQELQESPLGKKSPSPSHYDPSILYSIPREIHRKKLFFVETVPFFGVDIWNCFELSWLDPKGKAQVGVATLSVPCESPFLIESKSMKLYFHSLNFARFSSLNELQSTIEKDLSEKAGAPVEVKICKAADFSSQSPQVFKGFCLDELPVEMSDFSMHSDFLHCDNRPADERLYTHLFRSLCPITAQPDWASIFIHYVGPRIQKEGLLKYFLSFRKHQEFHENCVERIYKDILDHCRPQKLSIYARFTRRGGIDINPFRSNWEKNPSNEKTFRQ